MKTVGPYDYLSWTHDLPSLGDWGPFARDVYGLSHIADFDRGLRLDFFMVPGLFRRQFYWPDPLREAGCSPISASPRLDFFAFRQDFEGLDKFYCDMSYLQVEKDLWLGRCEFVNKMPDLRSAMLLLYTRISPRPEVVPQLPENCTYTGSLDYCRLSYSRHRIDENLTTSGGRRGEESYPGTVGSTCLGKPRYDGDQPCFGHDAGDSVSYQIVPSFDGKVTVYLRCRAEKGQEFGFTVKLNGKAQEIRSCGTGAFELIAAGSVSGDFTFELVSGGVPGGLRIDGVVTCPENTPVEELKFAPLGRAVDPVSAPASLEQCDTFTAATLPKSYAVWWSCKESVRREYWLRNLSQLVAYSNNLRHAFYYSFPNSEAGDEFCHDSYILPVEIPGKDKVVIYTLYTAGDSTAAAEKRLKDFDRSNENLEKIYLERLAQEKKLPVTSAGRKYLFGRNMMACASLTNVNFPIRAEGRNIRHHVPDKHFNSLYSWDSGFIGLGFIDVDKTRAVENLNVYVTEPENKVNAFIFHGTPLPVQGYLYWELFNRFNDKDMLSFFYPKVKHFYDFLAGHIATSDFCTAKSRLIRPWNYTYNSGGWDDYPPQWEVLMTHHHSVAPVVNTAHQIRFAKILRQAALLIGKTEDIAVYDRDIADFTSALQTYSYDPQEQIFSMVEHDADGNPTGFFFDRSSGRNYNLGMDGVSPLVSGICTAEQKELLFDRLSDPRKMWTPIGISTVDKRAPYYRTDGYWNGAVWMPHQWFFWKAALDDNRPEFARKIALTALELWEKALRRTRYCFEHFCLSSQQGAGCCHFGGLSSPVLNWFGAYCVKGNLTCGYEVWVTSQQRSRRSYQAQLVINGNAGEYTTLLYTSGSKTLSARFNGAAVPAHCGFPGCWEIALPKAASGTLELEW